MATNGTTNEIPNGVTNGIEKSKYIRWDAHGVEEIPPGEAEDVQAVVEQINTIQKAQYNCHRHMYGGMQLSAMLVM
jgi:hypothetical protein